MQRTRSRKVTGLRASPAAVLTPNQRRPRPGYVMRLALASDAKAAWTVRALDALELDRFHLVVHDIAGPIGFDVVARIPDRVASLTALNTIVRVASFKRPWSMGPFARRGIGQVYLRTLHPFAFERLMGLEGGEVDQPIAGELVHSTHERAQVALDDEVLAVVLERLHRRGDFPRGPLGPRGCSWTWCRGSACDLNHPPVDVGPNS